MHGEMGVNSEEHVGSTFWFTASLQACPEPVAKPVVSRPAASQTSSAERVRILVAEDNLVNQKVAGMILGRAGYQIDIVSNGLQALQAVALSEYDLILMDCRMPEMDGLEATTHIRELLSTTSLPIVAMTANSLASDRQDCIDAEMNDFISKPIRADQLLATVADWLATSNSTQT